MPFYFAHPAALWLLPAVALPVLFHLFFRLRRTERDFPSLMFFLRIDPRLSAKRKVHEWLILILRCLFLLLLILALARPLLGWKGAGGNVARLVLIDNSGSMAAPARTNLSKLTLAGRAAEKLISASQTGDAMAAQLMFPDATAPLPGGFGADSASLREALNKLTPSDGAAPVPKAIRLALATLDTASAAQRELHIFTDLQSKNWSRGNLEGEALPPNFRIVIHRIGSDPLEDGSVSLELSDLPTRAIPVGRITPVRAILRNNGPKAAQARLNTSDDSGSNSSRDLELAPNAALPVALTFSFPRPGFHWAQLWVEGDAAPTGTKGFVGFWCNDVRKAIFVGAKDAFAALPFAVSPGGNSDLSGINTEFVEPSGLKSAIAAKPLAIIITWDKWPQDTETSRALDAYVHQGGTLLMVPPPDATNTVSSPVPAWFDASLGAVSTAKEPEPMIFLEPGDGLWRDLRDDAGKPKLGTLRLFQYRPLTTGPDWKVLATSSTGRTLLARHEVEKGRIYISGLAFSAKWSSLPLKAGFVVMIQNAIFGNDEEQLPVKSLIAAEEYRFDQPGGDASIKSQAGSGLEWRGVARDFAGFPRAGVFEIRQPDSINWAAVSGNADEAVAEFLPLAPVPLLRHLRHDVVPLVHEEDVMHMELTPGAGASMFRWLMLAALLVLLMETWLANERSSDLGRKLFASLNPFRKPEAGKA